MQTIDIPIAEVLNSEAAPGTHKPNETPYIKNMRLEYGSAYKRYGYSVINEFTGPILGAFRATQTCMILAVADSDGASSGKLYTWDLNLSSPTFTKITGGSFTTGYSSGKYPKFHFAAHYDSRVALTYSGNVSKANPAILSFAMNDMPNGAAVTFPEAGTSALNPSSTYYLKKKTASTCEIYTDSGLTSGFDNSAGTADILNFSVTVTPCLVTVIANGHTSDTPYAYRHESTPYLMQLPSTKLYPDIAGSLKFGAQLKAKYVASLKDVLYWAGITGYDGSGTTLQVVQRRAIYSVIKDIGDYSDWDNYKDFLQGGDEITGILPVSDNLYVGRTDSIWMTSGGYGTFAPVATDMGVTNQESFIEYRGTPVFVYRGKVMMLNQDQPHLSRPIHTLFAAEDPGDWELVRGIANPYGEYISFSTGNKIFTYSFKFATWSMDEFDENVEIVSTILPGSLTASGWADPISRHSFMSVAEEDTISDPIVIVGAKKLARCNHFHEEREYGLALTADGEGIEALYETPLINIAQDCAYAVARGLFIQGECIGSLKVEAFFSDRPQKPVWGTAETVTLDSRGQVQLDLDSGRCRYVAFRITSDDINEFKLHKLGLMLQRSGRR